MQKKISDENNNTIQQNFYGSNFFLVRIPWLAHKAYRTARDNWISSLEMPRQKLILDIGCSDGSVLQNWSEDNTIIGLDCEASVLAQAREHGLLPLLGDMKHLPFKENQFDMVCAFGVLGINGPPQIDISCFSEVLKQQGELFLSVALFGGVRCITRTLVKLFNVKNQMTMIPRLKQLEEALHCEGFDILQLATSPLVPSRKLYRNPGVLARSAATYAFIVARKK